jgi:hypothetical protein
MTLEAAVDQLMLEPQDVVHLDAQTAAVVRGVPAGVELLFFQRFAGGSWDGVGAATGALRPAGDGRAGSVPCGGPPGAPRGGGVGPGGGGRRPARRAPAAGGGPAAPPPPRARGRRRRPAGAPPGAGGPRGGRGPGGGGGGRETGLPA